MMRAEKTDVSNENIEFKLQAIEFKFYILAKNRRGRSKTMERLGCPRWIHLFRLWYDRDVIK